jgi:hypothetical protein
MRNLSILLALCGVFGLVSENAIAASGWQMKGAENRADRIEAIEARFQDKKLAKQDRKSSKQNKKSAKLDKKSAKLEKKIAKIIERLELNYESRPEEAQKIFSWDDVESFYADQDNPLQRFISNNGKFSRFHFGKHSLDFQSLVENNPKFAEYFQTKHPELSGVTASVVPIPASVWLFGSALGALGWARRRKSVV